MLQRSSSSAPYASLRLSLPRSGRP